MDLIGSLSESQNIRGITLNSQQIDLFNIISTAQTREEAIEKVNAYLMDILKARTLNQETESQNLSIEEKIKKIIGEIDYISDKKAFINFLMQKDLMQISAHSSTRETLENFFEGKSVDPTYIDAILDIKKYIAYQTNGILTFLVDGDGKTIDVDSPQINVDKEKTFQKVVALYEHVVGSLENGEKRYTRLTLDGQGKFGTVAGGMSTEKESRGEMGDYNLDPLRQGYVFAQSHGMNEVYINALVFFQDFPDRLVGGTKEQYEMALINYGKAVASVAREYEKQGIHTVVDVFNEFVDYYAPFSERTNAWMSKLNIEDLCKIALAIKAEMPNATFGYNDWNFENDDKKKRIFEVIRKIQTYEKENDCKILDHIGTQCHTSINDLDGLRQSVEELQQFGLPVDITELDISKGLDGVDYEKATPEELAAIRKYEQKLQNDVMKLIDKLVREGKIRGVTVWSITDELCCDFCDGKEASVTGMTYDGKEGFSFCGKDMDEVIEMTPEEIELIQNHRARVRENNIMRINQNPIQDFCFHTHTQRCGHGAKDTGDEEWVQSAVQAGITKIAFTDHIPLPDGCNKTANSRMDIAEVDAYLESIDYLKATYAGQIEIESGFEFEYSDRDKNHLKELKNKTDKMILGQHFVIDENNKEIKIERGAKGQQISDDVLEKYAQSIISAINEGLPHIIAHPDIFMQARDQFGELEEKITRLICKAAIEKGVPLEINFGKIASKLGDNISIEDVKGKVSYPSSEFWKIVAEETRLAAEKGKDLIVFYGKDAHYPEQLSTEKDYEIANAIIGEETLEQLHLVTSHKDLEYQNDRVDNDSSKKVYTIDARDMAIATKSVKYKAVREVGKKFRIKNYDIGGR